MHWRDQLQHAIYPLVRKRHPYQYVVREKNPDHPGKNRNPGKDQRLRKMMLKNKKRILTEMVKARS
jgi:hypothetical protein